jgi:hypothetical protein
MRSQLALGALPWYSRLTEALGEFGELSLEEMFEEK